MSAAATVAGQNLGAGRPERSVQGVHRAALLGLALAAVIGVLFLTLPRFLLGLFGMTDPVVVGSACSCCGSSACRGSSSRWPLTYTGGPTGHGDTRSPLFISIASQIVVPLGLCALLGRCGRSVPRTLDGDSARPHDALRAQRAAVPAGEVADYPSGGRRDRASVPR